MKSIAIVVLLSAVACTSESSRVTSDPTPTGSFREETVEWFLKGEPAGRALTVVYTMSGVASGCEKEGGARVDEGDDMVVVSAWKSVLKSKNVPCTEELAYVDETVTLREDLGARALVGCRPGNMDPSEDEICRDPERSRNAGVLEVP